MLVLVPVTPVPTTKHRTKVHHSYTSITVRRLTCTPTWPTSGKWRQSHAYCKGSIDDFRNDVINRQEVLPVITKVVYILIFVSEWWVLSLYVFWRHELSSRNRQHFIKGEANNKPCASFFNKALALNKTGYQTVCTKYSHPIHPFTSHSPLHIAK